MTEISLDLQWFHKTTELASKRPAVRGKLVKKFHRLLIKVQRHEARFIDRTGPAMVCLARCLYVTISDLAV